MKQCEVVTTDGLKKCDFSRTGLYEHIEDAAGKDPLEWMDKFKPKDGQSSDTVKVETKDIAVFLYAGHNSYLDVNGEKNVDFATVRRWVRAMTLNDYETIVKTIFSAISDDPQEGTGKGE